MGMIIYNEGFAISKQISDIYLELGIIINTHGYRTSPAYLKLLQDLKILIISEKICYEMLTPEQAKEYIDSYIDNFGAEKTDDDYTYRRYLYRLYEKSNICDYEYALTTGFTAYLENLDAYGMINIEMLRMIYQSITMTPSYNIQDNLFKDRLLSIFRMSLPSFLAFFTFSESIGVKCDFDIEKLPTFDIRSQIKDGEIDHNLLIMRTMNDMNEVVSLEDDKDDLENVFWVLLNTCQIAASLNALDSLEVDRLREYWAMLSVNISNGYRDQAMKRILQKNNK